MIYKLTFALAVAPSVHGAAFGAASAGRTAVTSRPSSWSAATRARTATCQIPAELNEVESETDSLETLLDILPGGAEPPLPAFDLNEAVEAVAAEATNGIGADDEAEEAAAVEDPERPRIASFPVDPKTVAHLASQGITHMTPIQAQSFEALRSGRDMLGRSRTGTGKTLAFSLPLVERLKADLLEAYNGERPPRGRAPSMLVLAPTRELAKQVGEVITGLSTQHGLFTSIFVGGTPYPPQQRALTGGIDILVGTPGRIIDHLNNGDLDLSQLRICVLDEADEMLNMGFKEDVETILEGSSNPETRNPDVPRQTVLFSATHPPWVRQVSAQYQTDVLSIDAVGKGNSEAASTVEHRAVLTPGTDTARCSTLADVIAVYGTDQSRTIVFTSTRRECDELCASAPLSALSPQALHGDVSQNQRDVTLKRFREGHFSVLVATDVAARGIDISGVDLIVQYRMPQDPDSYVHRSGRTGRAGRNGVSLLLYSEREQHEVRRLEQRANVRFLRDGPPSTTTVMAAAAGIVPRRLKAVQPKVKEYFEEAAAEILAGDDALEQVSRALALVAGKVTLTERSLLTGEDAMTTLLLEATDGTPLTPGDAMSAVSALGSKPDSTDRLADHVGKIRGCQDPSKLVFDLPAAMADDLIALAETFDAASYSGNCHLLASGAVQFTQCIELPTLRDRKSVV